MSKQRADIDFDQQFEQLNPKKFKPKAEQGSQTWPPIAKEEIRQVAEATGFTSRESTPITNTITGTTKRRVHRTGRNEQFNTKVEGAVKQGFYAIAEQQDWVLGETLQYALEALREKLQVKDAQSSTSTTTT